MMVWILQHGILFWAGCRAADVSWHEQLAFRALVAVEWLGRRSMLWKQLISMGFELANSRRVPDLFDPHLGENDLPQTSGVDLTGRILEDLLCLAVIFPAPCLVWVNWLPRRVWREQSSPG